MDSTRGGERRQGAPYRARGTGTARPPAGNAGMGASTATAPCGARSTRLGRVAGGADGGGGGGTAGVNRSAVRIRTTPRKLTSRGGAFDPMRPAILVYGGATC